jgi:hypothetical protein
VQLFSGSSAVGLVAIFYCLRFEAPLLVASYESQVYGGGIQPSSTPRREIYTYLLVCMYVFIRVGHKAGPCTATFNDLLCFPFQLALY